MTVYGGIGPEQMTRRTNARLLPDLGGTTDAQEDFQAAIAYRPGVRAIGVLSVGAAVVNGDVLAVQRTYLPALTYKTFEVDIINTDSGVNTVNTAAGALADAGVVAVVTLGAAPATAISVGDVIRIENEMLLVLRKTSTTVYVCARAYAGTARAAHAQNLDVFVSDSVPTNISVPLVTTLTAAAFAVAFVAVFNWVPPLDTETAPARTTPHARADGYTAMPSVGLGAGAEILIVANLPRVDIKTLSEEFANSTDNIWMAATMTGGADAGVKGFEVSQRVPTATEVLLGEMHFAFPFVVAGIQVAVRVTASGVIKSFLGTVVSGYVESTDATLPSTIVTVRNVGAASTAYSGEFAATDTVQVIAFAA